MVERIEKVTRVKGISYDAYRPFERKDGYQDKGNSRQSFSQALKGAVGRQEQAAAGSYRVELRSASRATQSLFYLGGLDLSRVKSYVED